MDDIDRNTNYFDLFKLSMQDSRDNNCAVLDNWLKRLKERRDEDGVSMHRSVNRALRIFGNEVQYKEYLEYWRAKEQGARNQRLLEEELRKAKEELRKAEELARDETKRGSVERQKAKAIIEEANRQVAAAQAKVDAAVQRATAPPKTAWHRAGEYFKRQLNLPEDGLQAMAIDLLADRFSNRQNPQLNSSVNQQPTNRNQIINLVGNWSLIANGYNIGIFSFTQLGNNLSIQSPLYRSSLGPFAMQGQGVISGRVVQINYQSNDGGLGKIELEVSLDGRMLKGVGINLVHGTRFPVVFQRVGN